MRRLPTPPAPAPAPSRASQVEHRHPCGSLAAPQPGHVTVDAAAGDAVASPGSVRATNRQASTVPVPPLRGTGAMASASIAPPTSAIVAASISAPSAGAADSSDSAAPMTSPASTSASVPASAISPADRLPEATPVRFSMRTPQVTAKWSLSPANAARQSITARVASRAARAGSWAASNTVTMASPMILTTVPPRASTTADISSKYRVSSVRRASASSCSASAVDPLMSENTRVTARRGDRVPPIAPPVPSVSTARDRLRSRGR